MESRTMELINLLAGQEWKCRQAYRAVLWTQQGSRGRDELRVALKCIHMENTQLVGSCCITRGAETGAQRQPKGVGARFRGRGHMHIYG